MRNPRHIVSRLLFSCINCLFLAACATLPATQQEFIPGGIPTAAPSTPIPGTRTPSPTATLSLRLPSTDEVVLTITNPQPFSGREGDPIPEWPGWGAESISIAPDGSFWLADSYVVPPRLLHFGPSGEPLESIPLEGKAVYVYDLLVERDSVWLLDISSQPPNIVQLSLEGEVLRTEKIPQELFLHDGNPVANGVFNLAPGNSGELLASTVDGLYELLDASGVLTARRLEGISWAGHQYSLITNPISNTLSLEIDGEPVEFDSSLAIDSYSFIGFSPDGSFALALRREKDGTGDGPGVHIDPLTGYFSPSGELLGLARRWPTHIYLDFNHDLALGPDGRVYQLVTNPDHSVQIVSLGFGPDYASLPQPPEISSPPVATEASPRLPLWETPPAGASEQEIARETLVRFFTLLDQRRYEEAASLYGGDFSEVSLEHLPGETDAAYWERFCAMYTVCLPVYSIPGEEKIAEEEYRIFVEFLWRDGTRFIHGPCCSSNPAQSPGVWQFAYPVERVDGQWKVMRAPLYIG